MYGYIVMVDGEFAGHFKTEKAARSEAQRWSDRSAGNVNGSVWPLSQMITDYNEMETLRTHGVKDPFEAVKLAREVLQHGVRKHSGFSKTSLHTKFANECRAALALLGGAR